MSEEEIENKLKPVFECPYSSVSLISGDIELANDYEDFKMNQMGFRTTGEAPINDWIGDNYYVIGIDSTMGDPFITDISNDSLPIYSMYSDDWTSLRQISKDFKTFEKILELLNESNINLDTTKDETEAIVKRINEIESDYINYWEEALLFQE